MGRHIIFKCPQTGMNVQHWLADEPISAGQRSEIETVTCQACTKLHFITRSTGKLLGEPEK
jgi:hypothetical protein